MVQVCQNSAGIFCQNGAGSEKISVQEILDRIIICSYFNCNRINKCSGQSKQSEFSRLASILRYVTKLDIVIVAISYFDINHSLRSIFGEDLSMNLKRLLGSKRTNEYSWQNKQSKFTRLVPCLRYTLWFTVDICQS